MNMNWVKDPPKSGSYYQIDIVYGIIISQEVVSFL